MKITILEDNNACSTCVAEWGFSAYIEYNDSKILLDAGQSGKFLDNAKVMGVAMESVDFAVLSHAHYDHADGFPYFFAVNPKAPLYISANARENCYKINGALGLKYIGIQRGFFRSYDSRLRRVSGVHEIVKGVYIVPHTTPELKALGKRAKMMQKGKLLFRYEDFSHEQSLVFDTPKGMVIFNSCSHGGADNIINEVKTAFPSKQVYALIGGLHLHASKDEAILEVCRKLNVSGLKLLYTGHCSGENAISLLSANATFVVKETYAGLEIEL